MQIETCVRSASALMRRGRFTEALAVLKRGDSPVNNHAHTCLLADALQRTGHNSEAELLSRQAASSVSTPSDAYARYHFVLGNVYREYGDRSHSLDHFRSAEQAVSSDLELLCWVQLKLLSDTGAVSATEVAIPPVSRLKATLARCGEPRPLAAFHLWLAEAESTKGNLRGAQQHLHIAGSLLERIDDAWLQGFFAINSFGVNYHCGDILSARKWAHLAVEHSNVSGHYGARRASHANLGHIELAVGHLSEAEECFQTALGFCEDGSANHIAVLDSVAQVKLHRGDLDGCREIIDHIDRLSVDRPNVNGRDSQVWILQTKIQLLLKQGRIREAMASFEGSSSILASEFHSRAAIVLQLLRIETSVANRSMLAAAALLPPIFLSLSELPPDLFAETERVVGKLMSASGFPAAARIHFDRSIRNFDALGHTTGKAMATSDLVQVPRIVFDNTNPTFARCSLDRIRTLLEVRSSPDVFCREALQLLNDLDCCQSATVSPESDLPPAVIATDQGGRDWVSNPPRLRMPLDAHHRFVLELVTRADPSAIVSALTFQKVVTQIVATNDSGSPFEVSDALWSQDDVPGTQEWIFASERMQKLLKTIEKVASTNLSILITGETGVGKDVVAKSIHKRSDRARRPFIAINCTAVPKDLIESQLFGHRRGAFSGATESFEGVIRAAAGGTLFLDEIGDIPLDLQPKLLRFVESSEIHPIGESRPTKVNVRLLFATNCNLEEAVRKRNFREDLFFRLNVISVQVPPLRERREEIPALTRLFANKFSVELSKCVPRFSTEAMEALIFYSWPGNIRQLENEIRRLVAITDEGALITTDGLSPQIRLDRWKVPDPEATESPQITLPLKQPLSEAVRTLERSMVEYALRHANGHLTKAAQILGLSRKGLYLKRQRLGISDHPSTMV
jgi:hydrogenase-4 transcriptional activator